MLTLLDKFTVEKVRIMKSDDHMFWHLSGATGFLYFLLSLSITLRHNYRNKREKRRNREFFARLGNQVTPFLIIFISVTTAVNVSVFLC